MAEDGCDLLPDHVQDDPLPVGLRDAGEALRERASGLGAPGGDGRQAAQQRGQVTGPGLGPQRGRVELDGRQERLAGAERQVEQFEPALLGQRTHAGALQTGDVGLAELTRHSADVAPQAPGEGGGGQADGAA